MIELTNDELDELRRKKYDNLHYLNEELRRRKYDEFLYVDPDIASLYTRLTDMIVDNRNIILAVLLFILGINIMLLVEILKR